MDFELLKKKISRKPKVLLESHFNNIRIPCFRIDCTSAK